MDQLDTGHPIVADRRVRVSHGGVAVAPDGTVPSIQTTASIRADSAAGARAGAGGRAGTAVEPGGPARSRDDECALAAPGTGIGTSAIRSNGGRVAA